MNIKPRLENSKQTLRKVLIVCEGEETEPNYFQAFRVASSICKIEGTGHNTLSLVKEAVRLSKLENYRETWCVFDRDSFTEKSIKAAYVLAQKEGFKVAFSNECFELWYLLHFKYLDTQVNRAEYTRQLKKILGAYEKNSVTMYDMLLDKQSDAIKNAKKVNASHNNGIHPCECKPYTTVHELVERLNRLALKSI